MFYECHKNVLRRLHNSFLSFRDLLDFRSIGTALPTFLPYGNERIDNVNIRNVSKKCSILLKSEACSAFISEAALLSGQGVGMGWLDQL